MSKIALVTDTGSDFGAREAEELDLKLLHFQIEYKDKTYLDQVDITSQEVLDRLAEEMPTTSLPRMTEIQETFDSLREEGYKDVLVIMISSGLSGAFNTVRMIASEYTDMNIKVFDSRTLSAAEGVLVEKARELIDAGLEIDEIIVKLEEMRANQTTSFIVDTLDYLIKGGRIGRVSGSVGKLLNLKPVITVSDDGKYETIAKMRGKQKAIHFFADEASKVMQPGNKYELSFSHADAKDTLDTIIEEIKARVGEVTIKSTRMITPVACVHCGPGYAGMLIQKVN